MLLELVVFCLQSHSGDLAVHGPATRVGEGELGQRDDGQDVTSSVCQRLKNFARKRKINEPIRVLVRTDMLSTVTTRA